MLDYKSLLITGGTGSLGQTFINEILTRYPKIDKLIVFSRDEQKQYEMSQLYPVSKFPQLKFIIGDVRDGDRLMEVCRGIDFVVHAAAMKYVPVAEHNPMECIKTNILGAENIIKACVENNVERVVSLSTDKAAAPISLYGATKLASDKLFIAANTAPNNDKTIFSVVRYGNVMGSSGSVIPFFIKNKAERGVLPITNPDMTRFNISLSDGIDMVFHALEKSFGGEIFIPKISSYKIMDLAKAIGPDCEIEVVGIRPGEKIHEDMITISDAGYTYDLGKYYTIIPAVRKWDLAKFVEKFNAKEVAPDFRYNSGENANWETIDSLRDLIIKNVDPTFQA